MMRLARPPSFSPSMILTARLTLAPFRRLAPPVWIPVTPVIVADGYDDWGDENDGVAEGGYDLPAVILGLARESRGTKATPLGICISTIGEDEIALKS